MCDKCNGYLGFFLYRLPLLQKAFEGFFSDNMIINKELLEKYIKGEASSEERMDAYKWILSHPAHYNRYLFEKRLYELSIYQDEPESKNQNKNRYVLWMRICKYAAVSCAIVGAFFIRDVLNNKDIEDSVLQAISVPVGQRTSVTLSDGTNIELGSNTKLVFPAIFEKDKRKVHLEGSAYFHVAENREKPFWVTSQQGAVQVTGTTFYVDAIPQYDIFKTSLMEGEIKIHPKNNPENVITLRPGQQSILKDGKLTVQIITDYDEFLWREGIIAFKDKTIEEILLQLQNYYNIPILIKRRTSSTNKHTYTGKFYQLDGIDYALQILQEQVGFSYERDEENQKIYIQIT